MRTTVIPAQITTVEDKIAGNLNFTQILLLLSALMTDTFIYAVLPQGLHFTMYKLPLMAAATLLCLILSLRIKGRVVLSWLLLLSLYYLRPGFYIFNKNDPFSRKGIIFAFDSEKPDRIKAVKTRMAKDKSLSLADLIKTRAVPANFRPGFNFKFNRKGGLDVSISEIKS